MRKAIVMTVTAIATTASADTLYLCKNYSGGMFWSSAACSTQKALIDRTVTVPNGMPFDQQVALGEQVKAQGEALAKPPAQTQQTVTTSQSPSVNCKAISTEIASIDAMARQPQSGSTQNWISDRRRALRDTQFRNRCR